MNNRGNVLFRFDDMDHVLGNATSHDLALERNHLTNGHDNIASQFRPELTSQTGGYWSDSGLTSSRGICRSGPSNVDGSIPDYTYFCELDDTSLPAELPG